MKTCFTKKTVIFIFIGVLALSSVMERSEAADKVCASASADVAATYYVMGAAIAESYQEIMCPAMRPSSPPTTGSEEALRGVETKLDGTRDGAFFDPVGCQGGQADFKKEGKFVNIRQVLNLHMNVWSPMVLKGSSIKSFTDLKGKFVAIPSSGALVLFRDYLRAYRIENRGSTNGSIFPTRKQPTPCRTKRSIWSGSTSAFPTAPRKNSPTRPMSGFSSWMNGRPKNLVKEVPSSHRGHAEGYLPGGRPGSARRRDRDHPLLPQGSGPAIHLRALQGFLRPPGLHGDGPSVGPTDQGGAGPGGKSISVSSGRREVLQGNRTDKITTPPDGFPIGDPPPKGNPKRTKKWRTQRIARYCP